MSKSESIRKKEKLVVDDTAQIEFRQVRNFSAIITATYHFQRQNFRNLLWQILFIMGPLIVFLSVYKTYFFTIPVERDYASFQLNQLIPSLPLYTIVFITFLIYSSVIYAYIVLYMDNGFDQFETMDVLKIAAINLPKAFGFSIVSSIFILVATTVFILPGVYIAVPLTLGLIIIFREKMGIFETITRCFKIISGHWWQTFGIILITFFAIYLISLAVSFPEAIVDFALAGNFPEKADMSNWKALSLTLSVITTLISFVFYSIGYVSIALQYFNLVEQKEVYGLLKRIESIEKSERGK